jgi:hypothetical protein
VLTGVAAAFGPLCTITSGEAGVLRLDVVVIPVATTDPLAIGDATFVVEA